jgi:hypothetical protein
MRTRIDRRIRGRGTRITCHCCHNSRHDRLRAGQSARYGCDSRDRREASDTPPRPSPRRPGLSRRPESRAKQQRCGIDAARGVFDKSPGGPAGSVRRLVIEATVTV